MIHFTKYTKNKTKGIISEEELIENIKQARKKYKKGKLKTLKSIKNLNFKSYAC